MPQQSDNGRQEQKIEAIKAHLQDCLETGQHGKLVIKLKLPNQSALDSIAAALAKLTA